MENNIRLTILTTSYNRAKLLSKLYASLIKQTVYDFEWLIIDDGSNDNTKEYVASLPQNPFPIRYYYKENGGKCRAINFAHDKIQGQYVFFVDSDDVLTADAVEVILKDWQRYDQESNIAVLSYKKVGRDGIAISEEVQGTDYYIDDDIHYRVNQGVGGDRAETLRTDILRKYPFPEFVNEKFMSEGWLWNSIAPKYKTVYRMYTVYICEYLAGGLTKSGRVLRMKSPQGMMENCKSFFQKDTCIKIQLKEMLLYCVYALCSPNKLLDDIKNSGRPWKIIMMMPFGYGLYCYWKNKYLK